MKQGTKTALIIAASLTAAGILLYICTMAVNHWDYSQVRGSSSDIKTVEIPDDFDNISIHLTAEELRLYPSGGNTCRVVFDPACSAGTDAAVHDRTLFINSAEPADIQLWFMNMVFFTARHPQIAVYLPKSEYNSLFIDAGAGDISVPGDFSFDDISISSAAGNIRCLSSVSGKITIAAEAGSVNVADLSACDIDISDSVGSIAADTIVCSGDIRINSGTGETTLSDIACKSLISECDTGSIAINSVIASEIISVENHTGNVNMNRCDSNELHIVTDAGNVTGSLLSDKIFIVRSDIGHIEVPETTTGGICRISTGTGDISITISRTE